MIATTLLLIWKLFLPLLLVVAVIDWLTASDDRRVRILRRTGLTQQQIATRLNLSVYRVRKALAQ
jgi:DNA-binding CsgD family transcriptional regulator